MSLKQHNIPNDSQSYLKLKDFPDGEEIEVTGVGIKEGLKFGDIPFFITADGDELSLPTRYLSYIKELQDDKTAVTELAKGVIIVKGSRSTKTGGTTPTFEFKD